MRTHRERKPDLGSMHWQKGNGSGFGQISRTAGTSRQIQFSLKILY
jgi:hypothetical protein